MINIKRLLILAVLAAFAYFFWPRQASLLEYSAQELAELEAKAWQQAQGKQWVAVTATYAQIYFSQYHFQPFAAFSIAMNQSRAISVFRGAADDYDRSKAEQPLQALYDEIKSKTGRNYDPKTVAQKELRVWSLVNEDAKDEIVVQAQAEELALIYGGAAKKYLPSAQLFASARKKAKNLQWTDARKDLEKAWSALKKEAALP